MHNIMLDLETLSLCSDAAIISIGAVEFDVPSQAIGERFYNIVDIQSSLDSGGIVDGSTLLWWLEQSHEARSEFQKPSVPLAQALQQFAAWLDCRNTDEPLLLWGNGAAFDNVVLASAYRRLQLATPWQARNNRCYRTVKSFHPDIPLERVGVHHNPVDDAESQARHLMRMLSGGVKP